MKSSWVQWVDLSRTDSLPFKDRSFSCTLDLIDLVMQIQPFQKGWTLKPDVSGETVRCVIFGCSNPSFLRKVWRDKPKYSHLVFLVFLASIMQSHPLENEILRRQLVDYHAHINEFRHKVGLCQSFVASHIVYHSHQLRIDSFSVTFIW